jgi:hypothetical protein
MLSDRPASRRWPRGQKFELSAPGVAAEAAHREALQGARASGRQVLEAALAAWAGPLQVDAGDGVVLSELRGGRRGMNDLVRGLEEAGIEPAQVKAAIDRLVAAGLVTPRAPGDEAAA